MVTQTEARGRLAALAERKGKARDRLALTRTAVQAARKAKDGDAEAAAQVEFEAAQAEVEVVTGIEMATLRQLSGAGQEFGAPLTSNPDALRALKELAASSAPIRTNVAVGPLMSIEETAALTGRALQAAVTLPDGPGRDNGWLGIAPTPTAPTSLLDFFQSVPFGTRKAEFLRRDGGVANAAIQVEGAVKAEAGVTYTDDEAEAVTIASWLKTERQKLDDIDGLLPDLQVTLNHGVLVQVEAMLVGSSAPSGAPPGILTSTGIASPTITSTNLADAVGEVKAQLSLSGVEANFVAAHPTDIENEESRTTSGSGDYVGTIDAQGRIRRLPLVPSIALQPKQILMGDSRIGARLGVRSPVSVVVGQEQDDMTRNRVTVLAEGRWAPVVLVPSAFAEFNLP